MKKLTASEVAEDDKDGFLYYSDDADARISELESVLRRMIDRGDRCNWFADQGDEQIRDEALAVIGKTARHTHGET